MDHVTQDYLVRKHGKEKGEAAFAEIAELGGFGDVGPMESQLHPDAALDVKGVLDPENKAVSDAAKKRIKELIEGTKEAKPEKNG